MNDKTLDKRESIKIAPKKREFQVGDSIYFPGRRFQNVVTIYKEDNEPKSFKHGLYILLAEKTQGIIVDMMPHTKLNNILVFTSHGKYVTHYSLIAHTEELLNQP